VARNFTPYIAHLGGCAGTVSLVAVPDKNPTKDAEDCLLGCGLVRDGLLISCKLFGQPRGSKRQPSGRSGCDMYECIANFYGNAK